MIETSSMTRNQNHDDDEDDASTTNTFKTSDIGYLAPWSDLNHDVLFLVIMQLGVIDFIAFSGVCKSWRSHALSNIKNFMASIPPMSMWIRDHAGTKECYCYLEDSEGRKFKTILPNSFGRQCLGLTCGYLVLYEKKTKDFWLVNPITRRELHIPPLHISSDSPTFKAILVFSPSINGMVFVVSSSGFSNLWYLVVDKGVWKRVPASFIHDLHVFKGKIYALSNDRKDWFVYELKLTPNPELISPKIKNYPKLRVKTVFISSDENLYVMDYFFLQVPLQELDFGEMKWVSPKEKTIGEYAFFQSELKYGTSSIGELKYGAAIKPKLWAAKPPLEYKGRKRGFFRAGMWYFPHDCLNVNLLNE